MIPIEIHSEAAAEYLEAIDYYRAQNRSAAEGLAVEFRATLKRIADRPFTGSPGECDTRRKYLRRFPYTIIYRIDPGQIQIVAVMHQLREPLYWQTRI